MLSIRKKTIAKRVALLLLLLSLVFAIGVLQLEFTSITSYAVTGGPDDLEDCDGDGYDDTTNRPLPWLGYDTTKGDPKNPEQAFPRWDGQAGSYEAVLVADKKKEKEAEAKAKAEAEAKAKADADANKKAQTGTSGSGNSANSSNNSTNSSSSTSSSKSKTSSTEPSSGDAATDSTAQIEEDKDAKADTTSKKDGKETASLSKAEKKNSNSDLPIIIGGSVLVLLAGAGVALYILKTKGIILKKS